MAACRPLTPVEAPRSVWGHGEHVSLAPCPLEFASVLGARPNRDLPGPRHPSGRAPPRGGRRRSSAAWLRAVRESQTGGRATFVAIRAADRPDREPPEFPRS